MTSIVGVHGVGNFAPGQPAASVVQHRSAAWATSLAGGLGQPAEALQLEYVYYAPYLHDGLPVAQATVDPEHVDAALDRLDDETRELVTSWVESLELPSATPQGRLAVPLRHAVEVAATRFSLNGRVTKLFVATCFPEVARYLGGADPSRRTRAREHVAARIAERRPRVVIAHSLGSVVTYEALHAHPELDVELLLTLGSPLALPRAIFDRLDPAPQGGAGRRPPGVRRWVNISDHGDPVAILRPLKRYFPDIDLDLTESISLFDFHRGGRYLGCAAAAAAVAPYLD